MIFTLAFFLNIAANFVFGIAIGAILGVAEFGRFATVSLAAITLGVALFDWLRYAALRFWSDESRRLQTAASLDLAYLAVMALLAAGFGVVGLSGARFGLSPLLLALTPVLAVAYNRLEYSAVLFRTREQPFAFATLYGLRQVLAFTLVIGVATYTRDAAYTVGALAAVHLIAALLVSPALRTPGVKLSAASQASLLRFLAYAKPIVASLAIYQIIALINRQVALEVLGADATGKLSLATDMGQRLFQAANALPEMLLFQYALTRERNEGRASAERQLGVNATLVLALLIPMAAGYMSLAPILEALVVPAAYRGDFASLSVELAPGFLAFYAIASTLNPVFQLAKRTWPLTLAALAALATDLILLKFSGASQDIHALARAYSISLCVGYGASALLALRNAAVRPPLRDIAVIIASAGLMAFALRPLNEWGHPALGALAALAIGGGLYAAAMVWFDVAGLRGLIAQGLSAIRIRRSTARTAS